MSQRIHLSVPHMGQEELHFVQQAFATNWLSSVGPNLPAFEQAVTSYLGGGVHGLAVSSGTAALHLILRYLEIGAGDRVAVSTLTFVGSVFPIQYVGAEPVFLDSQRDSANIDPEIVAEYFRSARAAGTLPKALVVVHLYGQHADLDPIAALCEDFGVTLIEDAAESLGSTYKGRQTGTTADYSILSFNGNKIITTTGGGMVLARDRAAIDRMRKWSTQSREPAVEYLHREVGYNYRMSNVLAGIGLGQMSVLDERVAARRRVAQRYAEALADLEGVDLLPEMPWGRHTRWLSVIEFDRDLYGLAPSELVEALDRQNIECRPIWRPMHTQPLYTGCTYVGSGRSDSLFANGLCLPSSSSMGEDDQNRVIEALRGALSADGARGRGGVGRALV